MANYYHLLFVNLGFRKESVHSIFKEIQQYDFETSKYEGLHKV